MSGSDPGDSRRLVVAAAVLGSILVAAWQSDLELGRLVDADGAASARDIAGGLLAPDLSRDFVARVGRLALESLFIGVLGTALALVIGIPLALAAAQLPGLPDDPMPRRWRWIGRAGRQLARGLLALLRSVPEIVWAMLFVRIVGLGPGPAVLALGLTFGGIIGKLYAELLEAADPRPARRLREAGAGWLAMVGHALLPQVRRQWVAYGLFRLECAIRSASILGVVGAGGLGGEIQLSISYFQYDKLATTLLAVLLFIAALEAASFALRRAKPAWPAGILAALSLAAIGWLEIPWDQLIGEHARGQLAAFASGFAHPNLEPGFVLDALGMAATTVAMAWCATVLASCAAFALAPLAALSFTVRGYLDDPPRGAGPARWLTLAVVVPARLILQVTRALPELVWALIFVVWVEPGPTAGVLALTAHTVGILGRLYSDVLEEAEPEPPRLLEAAGVGRLGRYLFGVMPQAMPRMLAFTLFRFEVNIRNAAMVGFVGAGGLGNELHTAISLFHWDNLATLLAVLIAMVLVVDGLGDRMRRRFLA